MQKLLKIYDFVTIIHNLFIILISKAKLFDIIYKRGNENHIPVERSHLIMDDMNINQNENTEQNSFEPAETASAVDSFNENASNEPIVIQPSGEYTYQSPAAQGSASSSARPQYQGYQTQGSYTYQTSPYSTPSVNVTPPFANAVPKKEKKSRFSFATLIVCILITAILSSIISIGVSSFVAINKNGTGSVAQSNDGLSNFIGNSNTTITNNTDNYVEAVAAKVQPSVVGIVTKYSEQSFFGGTSETGSEGSGVIYTSDGYIITNKHVIEKAITYKGEIAVYLHGKLDTPYKATVIGYDSSVDLAVIKIDASNLPAAEIGSSEDLKIGQNAVAVGCPGGLGFMGSVSVGYISGLDRKVSIDSTTMNLIQTDTAINPGNSGGALVDNEGKLIGITNAKLVDEEFEGMGFAIPVDTVTEICNGIIAGKDEPKPYIGVQINTNYTASVLERYGFPAGAVVGSVIDNGPADKAGIRQYDIIVMVDNDNITSYDTLSSAISKHKVGDNVKVKVYRNNKYLNLDVTLTANG